MLRLQINNGLVLLPHRSWCCPPTNETYSFPSPAMTPVTPTQQTERQCDIKRQITTVLLSVPSDMKSAFGSILLVSLNEKRRNLLVIKFELELTNPNSKQRCPRYPTSIHFPPPSPHPPPDTLWEKTFDVLEGKYWCATLFMLYK